MHGLWQPGAESPVLGLLTAASFPAPMFKNSATFRNPCNVYDLGDPETTESYLGFCPMSSPEQLSGRDIPHWSSAPVLTQICVRDWYN